MVAAPSLSMVGWYWPPQSIRNSILTGNVGASAANANIYLFYSSTVTIDTSNVTGVCPVGVTCTNSMDYVVALQPLDWNGGPTQTMMLGVNSASIDRAANATCLPIDQRGYVRPQGAKCDLGAVERRVFPFSVSVIGNGSVSSSIAGNIANCTASGGQCGTTHDGDTVPPISFDLIAMPAVGYYPNGAVIVWVPEPTRLAVCHNERTTQLHRHLLPNRHRLQRVRNRCVTAEWHQSGTAIACHQRR